nr:tyrosine-type recombinase/integrase [Enterococcus plantarum]
MLTVGITDPKLIFCGIYNQVVSHHSIYKRLQTITEKCGIPFLGVHITRHTHASLLLESGASMKEVQERLRHASIKMTMDTYSHLSQESKKKQLKNW